MSGIPRKRASLACSECNRRKLRCDKSIPCQRCVESGLGGSCARPGPVYRGRHSVSNDVDPSQRITQPGDELAVPEQSTSSSSPPNGVQLAVQQETFEIADREVTDAATILEFLAWGRRKEVSYATQLSPCVESPTLLLDDLGTVSGGHDVARLTRSGSDEAGHSVHLLQLLLPSRQKVYQLVNYHVNSLLWYHGSFHGPMFQRQLDDFYGKHKGDLSSPGLDLQWAALLFAVLTGSIACGNKASVLCWGFREPEQETLSHRWLDAVTTCLNIGQYMANASIRCCEAIATLTISAHILGYSDQQSILLASAVRIAQSLGLHRLNDCSPKSIERETGRRVWEQLCSQDWFSIPFSECYLINPLHSQTSEPLNCDDLTLQVIPPSQPTVTSYCRYLHLIAALMPQLKDSVATSNTLFTKYEQVLKFDRKMRNLASEQRPAYLGSAPIEPSWPRWISWARRAVAISSSHKIIMIHRKFLSMSFTNPAFNFTRRTCIAASKTILKEVTQIPLEDEPVLWIFHAFAVAAGITLCLDILHRDASDPTCEEHCELIEDALVMLRQAHNNKIASRGARILTDLLLLEKSSRSTRSSNKRRSEPAAIEPSSKRQRSIDMRHIVRDFQRGIPEQSHHGVESLGRPVAKSRPEQGTDAWNELDQCNARARFPPTFPAIEQDILGSEATLPDLQASYMSLDGDAFGSLLDLAQTYDYR